MKHYVMEFLQIPQCGREWVISDSDSEMVNRSERLSKYSQTTLHLK